MPEVPPATTPSRSVRNPVPPETRLFPRGWWFDGLLLVLLTVMTLALVFHWRPLLDLDVWVDVLSEKYRVDGPLRVTAANLERLGQGGPLTLLCVAFSIFHCRRQRSWEPLMPVAFAYFISYAFIGFIKVGTDREMPNEGPVELFTDPTALAYPSGHASNTILWYGLLSMLIAPLVWSWVGVFLRSFPLVVVGITTVYLHHHWLTDVFGGLIIGALVLRFVKRNPWRWVGKIPWLPGWVKSLVPGAVGETAQQLRPEDLVTAPRS